MSLILPLLTVLAAPSAAYAGSLRDHPGLWLGDLKTPDGHTLKLGVELYTRADGSPWAMVDSPDQGAYDIPVRIVHETGDVLDIDLSFAKLELVWVRDHFRGEWKQGGNALSIDPLRKVAAFPAIARPQTPTGPFPYKDETLGIASTDGVTLGATLSLPDGVAHPNVAILVHGSGPAARDELEDGHRTFAVLADSLARAGVAVLRYDKRGIARSTGDYENHTQTQLSDDLQAAVLAMRSRKQFARIGLIGHSEGSAIAAAVAAHHPDLVDFVVSLAGPGLPGIEMILLQDEAWAKDHGASADEIPRLMAYARSYYQTVVAQGEPEPRIAALKALFAALSPLDQELVKKRAMNEGTLSLEWAAKPFLRAMLMANPQADWRAVRCPVLAFNGSLDHQVPATENLAGITNALHAGGNPNVESAVVPSLNHMFQTAKTGNEDEYGSISETMAPVVLQRVSAFASGQR